MEYYTCSKCSIAKPLASFKKVHTVKSGACWCKTCCVEASLKCLASLKLEVFTHYGGKCAICAENDIDVLTIDHINQQGSKHRMENKLTTGTKTWKWLKDNAYPQGFRVLCFNCNTKEYRKFLRKQKELKMIKENATSVPESNQYEI